MADPKNVSPAPAVDAILDLIATLRGPNGCPWDRKQTPASLSVYLIEEVYELVEAIGANDIDAIGEELGDVLFQILFLAYLFHQAGYFALNEILERNREKMIRRHPHVFGSDTVEDAEQVKQRWRDIKKQEKPDAVSLLDSVPAGMPALMRAYRISERAAGVGFDWDDLQGVLHQAESEWFEFKAEIDKDAHAGKKPGSAAALELGDVLFTLVNVARLAEIHPETALQKATLKFSKRFKRMESKAAEQHTPLDRLSRQALEALWEKAKSMGD
jgi:nucleoside triphosphate diphosphatase